MVDLIVCMPNFPTINRKIIEIPIMDEEAYEKNLIMYVNIDEPRHIAGEWMMTSGLIELSSNILFILQREKKEVKWI